MYTINPEAVLTDLSMQAFLPRAKDYLINCSLVEIPGWNPHCAFDISPLGQGEYNMNFLVRQAGSQWVMRVNTGSQIGLPIQDQIAYEFKTLVHLAASGVSPQPYFYDNTLTALPFGVLGMSYLPGETLDYHRDLENAARVFARYHQLPLSAAENHLIHEKKPLSLTYERCCKMLKVYFESDLGKPELKSLLQEIKDWANQARQKEIYFMEDPWNCIINTEVNNTNWILNREAGTTHLVDWEKPLWGDPSQDLSHFRVPTTTLWKTDYLMSEADQTRMMHTYQDALSDRHLANTIEERTRLRDPFNCLRGVSWCAMAWVQYQQDDHLLKNEDTFRKLAMYVDTDFVHQVFDPYLTGKK